MVNKDYYIFIIFTWHKYYPIEHLVFENASIERVLLCVLVYLVQ